MYTPVFHLHPYLIWSFISLLLLSFNVWDSKFIWTELCKLWCFSMWLLVHSITVICFPFIRKADWSFLTKGWKSTKCQFLFFCYWVPAADLILLACKVQPEMKRHCKQQRWVWCRAVECILYLQKCSSVREGHSGDIYSSWTEELERTDRGISLKQVRMSRTTRKKYEKESTEEQQLEEKTNRVRGKAG